MEWWNDIRVICEALIAFGGAASAVVVGFKIIPMLWSRSILMARLQSAETAAREYRIACQEQHASIVLLESRNAELRKQNDETEARFTAFAAAAGSFIITLVNALVEQTKRLREAGISDIEAIPSIPMELEEAVAEARRTQIINQRNTGEAKVVHPFQILPDAGS